jgi:dTDP-4-amino-4,6-dideoxygalactose transaminase
VAQPLLPSLEVLTPYLAAIDRSRIYSNFGPLNQRLRKRFADLFDVPEGGVVTVSNATVGLSLALMAGRRPGRRYCLFPSWNFPAGPHAAVQAGLEPLFADVTRETGALDLASAEDVMRRFNGEVGAMVVVMPFGSPLDLAPYDAFASRHRIDLVIDAAAAIDTLKPTRRLAVISLHATKALGVGEGGLVVSTDAEVVTRVRRASNFGFTADRSVTIAAMNGKMSEYHAAVGHAALDEWPMRRRQWMAVAEAYRRHSSPRIRLQEGWGETWISATCVADFGSTDARRMAEHLNARGCETRRWWDGCHRQPAFARAPRVELPVTERLARAILGLPCYPDMTEATVVRVCDEVERAIIARDVTAVA